MKVKKNKFVADKVRKIMQEGKSMKQAVAIALSMWERKKKKNFGAGGAISDFGVQTTFSTDFVEDSTDVAELEDPSEEVLATSDPELDNPELTEEEIKALKKKKALQAAGKGAAVGATIGSAIPVVGTAVGAAAGALIGGLGSLLGNKGLEDQPELIMAKNGIKVHKKKRIFDKGGLLEALKQRRKKIEAAKEYYKEEGENPTMYLNEEGKIIMPDVSYDTGEPVYYETELTPRQYKRFNKAAFRNYKRGLRKGDREARRQERQERRDERRDERIKERGYRRVGRTTIQPYGKGELGGSAGIFNQYLQEVQGIPRRSVALDPEYGDASVLTHELIHSAQYGPLQQIAAELAFKNAGRIQDKDTRKAFRKLYKSIDPKDQSLNRLGEFMVGGKDQDIEFDAIIKSAISSAKKRGYDLSGKTYDEILDTLSKAKDEGNISLNMRHLGNFMNADKETGNTWTDEQKGYIMDAIKANLDFEGYTAEDVKQDLRYENGGKHDEKKEEDNTSATPDDDIYKLMALVKDSPAPQGTTYDESDDTMNMPQPRFVSSASERIQRQLFKESGGESDPDNAVSPAGAIGRFQIMPATQKDLEDRGFIPKGLDPTDPEDNRRMRDAKIDAILRTSLVSNPPKPITEINKLARIYASYNYGEGNVRKALNKAAADGVDIYNDPRLWFEYLPEETRNYVNYILFDE